MKSVDDNLKRAAFSVAVGARPSQLPVADKKAPEAATHSGVHHLISVGKVDLPHHPIRLRYLAYSRQRCLTYGRMGCEMLQREEQGPNLYSLQNYSWQIQMCDCVQTSDLYLYAVSRSHSSAVVTCYDEFMTPQRFADISYPLGCLSALATNASCSHLYAANSELNCVIRFTADDLSLNNAEQFGHSALWRPFDCCTSQAFNRKDGVSTQFLFVSNLDAGISVFDMDTMEIVAECGDDLLPGSKYLAYDSKRCLLFVTSSYERLLRCYKFEVPAPPFRPWLHQIGDFLVASRKPRIRSSAPQCAMFDPDTDHLVIVSWSLAKGEFTTKVFRVSIKDNST